MSNSSPNNTNIAKILFSVQIFLAPAVGNQVEITPTYTSPSQITKLNSVVCLQISYLASREVNGGRGAGVQA